jgi:hypothetical protein
VEDYHKKIEISMIQVNVMEVKETTMARSFYELNSGIVNVVELQYYIKLEDMVHVAINLERQIKIRNSSQPQFNPVSSFST